MHAKRKPAYKKIDTIEKLAQLMAEGFSESDKRFDSLEGRFDSLEGRFDSFESRFDAFELEVRGEFAVIKRMLDRIDTRLALLELTVFGASESDGGKVVSRTLLSRISKLEKAVFKK